MLEVLPKLGISGAVGVLLGIGIVTWVEPTTTGGIAFLILLSVIASMIVGGILFPGRKQNDKD